jgi:hypothetical protein|tara:strand:+ start:4390 stop:4923 length:534 start_codon:yes stop_codon:yes gene_type:complete
MAHIFFTTEAGVIKPKNIWDLKPFEDETLESGDYLVEYDFDPTVEEFLSLSLNDAKDTVVNRFPGKTLAEQKALLAEETKAERIALVKDVKTRRIKSLVADAIEPVEWRAERAIELDAIEGDGVTTRQAKVAAYRKAARDANNAHEAALLALTEEEDIVAFDPNWVPAFQAANPIDF